MLVAGGGGSAGTGWAVSVEPAIFFDEEKDVQWRSFSLLSERWRRGSRRSAGSPLRIPERPEVMACAELRLGFKTGIPDLDS